MNETPICRHIRTRLIAKDKDAEYVECLDCGTLFEVGELLKATAHKSSGAGSSASAPSEDLSTDESLSDA